MVGCVASLVVFQALPTPFGGFSLKRGSALGRGPKNRPLSAAGPIHRTQLPRRRAGDRIRDALSRAVSIIGSYLIKPRCKKHRGTCSASIKKIIWMVPGHVLDGPKGTASVEWKGPLVNNFYTARRQDHSLKEPSQGTWGSMVGEGDGEGTPLAIETRASPENVGEKVSKMSWIASSSSAPRCEPIDGPSKIAMAEQPTVTVGRADRESSVRTR